MRKEFELPDVGEGVAEGELVTWRVDVGDRVEEDEVIAEVETDKALVEIPSPYDGEVAELRAEEGDVVPVDEVFIVFSVDDEVATGDDTNESERGSDEATDVDASAETAVSSESADLPGSPNEENECVHDERAFAPPSVRRLARELDVDLAALRTDGARVTKRDVREAAREASEAEETTSTSRDGASPESTVAGSPDATSGIDTHSGTDNRIRSVGDDERADRDRTLAMPATRRLARETGIDIDVVPASERRNGEAFVTPEDVRAYEADDHSSDAAAAETRSRRRERTTGDPRPGDRIPYTGIRRTIGERMAESKYTAPHVSHHDEIEVSKLVDVRTQLKARAEERGIRLTYLPFVVKAVVAALRSVPQVNAELDEENEEIILHGEYNIGIAVASDAGLMVPVIENADRKGLLKIAREIDDKAERARERSIRPEELRGSTFTITNIGAVGGEHASPIINYPEAAILALGSLEERPWAEDGEIVARPTLPISMSADHRIIDGAEAGRFTNEVKRYLNDPNLLLLE
ncbi:2-oxo acid dehydrogenase subunit E2 [Halosolutus gelatinilyticus]|uniref:2-oxo acid dehydrogenase subunit E2 n=1 Tax=Halosolutus gelatinilyticus TaxID=2931975 RepID=UPI001FF14140|nr:2-oxo acid dehydrogenase subunit E2 [Halosolutus gelatinilyticus]